MGGTGAGIFGEVRTYLRTDSITVALQDALCGGHVELQVFIYNYL